MPTIEELQATIDNLRAEREAESRPTDPGPTANGGLGTPTVSSSPVKPEIIAVFLRDGGVVATTVGDIQLDTGEIKKISKIAAKAFKRAMANLVSAISEAPAKKAKPAKKTRKQRKAKKSTGPRLSKTGKPLGRPKKNKTVTYEPPVAPSPEPPSV